MFESIVFVSYRRSDAAPFAIALKLELERRLSKTLVFVDFLRIEASSDWPEVLAESIDKASLSLVLIGPKWLTEDGAYPALLFDEKDWVHREVKELLRLKKPILPILVAGGKAPQPSELPPALRKLLDYQILKLDPDSWHQGLSAIAETAASLLGPEVRHVETPWPKPNMIKRRIPVTTKEVLNDIKKEGILKEWRIELEHDYGGTGAFAEQLVFTA